MIRERRVELNMLSLLAFGVKSRWYTLMKKGTIIDGKHHAVTEFEILSVMVNLIEAKRKVKDGDKTE